MLEHFLSDIERDANGTPKCITRTGHLWIRNEMLAETKDARLQLYAIATRMESGPQEWTPADTAALRRAANVLNDTSMRLWLSSLFGLSYEME